MSNTFFLLPFDEEKAKKITEVGQFSLKEIRDYVKKHGVPIMDKTEYKEIGGVVYPVTINPYGIVIFDYPSLKPYVQNCQNPIVQDCQNPITQNNY